MTEMIYRQRPRPFAGEVIFTMNDTALTVDNGRRQEVIPFSQMFSLSLQFGYRNVSTPIYFTRLRRESGRTVTLSNLNWKGYVEVEAQDQAYSAFVRRLALNIARANPNALMTRGRPALSYLATAIVGIVSLGSFAAVAVWGLMRGNWLLATMAIIFLFPFARQVHGMITRNKPGLFDAKSPPDDLLPHHT